MTKKEFIELYAKNGNMSKKDAEKNINLFLITIQEALILDGDIGFVGWGKWEVKEKDARKVRNPQTKEMMTIEARKVIKFKPGKLLANKIK